MTDAPPPCVQCGAAYYALCPVMHEVRGVEIGELKFCQPRCALNWALADRTRLTAWLRRIVARSHGQAGLMAKRALRGRPADDEID
jgi:hypothetical protein